MTAILCESGLTFNDTHPIQGLWTGWNGTWNADDARPEFPNLVAIHAGGGRRTIHKDYTADATVIFGFRYYGGLDQPLAFIKENAGAPCHLTLYLKSTGALEVYRGEHDPNGSTVTGTLIGTSTVAVSANTACYIWVKAFASNTVGTVAVYVNSASVLSITGADTLNGGTSYGRFMLMSVTTNYFGDIVLMNGAGSKANNLPSPMGDGLVERCRPSGNGNSSQLVGSDANSVDNYLLVDEDEPSSVDYVAGSTDNNKDTYALENLASTTGTIMFLQARAYAAKSDSGARSAALIQRNPSGTITEEDGADFALAAIPGYGWMVAIFEDDPDGNNWTPAGVNAMEAGVKVRP